MEETFTQILEFITLYLGPVTAVVTAATAITALTPSKADNTILNGILKVLNLLAGNFLKNKNADA